VGVGVRVGVTVGVKLLVGVRMEVGVLVGRCRCETKGQCDWQMLVITLRNLIH
jgi:uncharacterized oligopeptide transporter (OPT) family protein